MHVPITPKEKEILSRPNVSRLANASQLYFLDYYLDLLSYVHLRRKRAEKFGQEFGNLEQSNYKSRWREYCGRERAYLRKRRTKLRRGDFEILTQVGQGGYGQVFLAKKKDSREICALKVMSKSVLFKLDEIRHVLTERDILSAASSAWLVSLFYAFQDEHNIYLAMEYVPGGDFRTLLNNTGMLHSKHCQFYLSEMFMAVGALHDLGYIHRDLKPENFLIDASGHIKLTDFGLSCGALSPDKLEAMRDKLENVEALDVPKRSVQERRAIFQTNRANNVTLAKSVVGSPDYMAPEILKNEPYDFTVDYWSLGCILYESLAGFPPFSGASIEETWYNLQNWKHTLLSAPMLDESSLVAKFLRRLLCAKEDRFHDLQSVQNHSYFASINWQSLRNIAPPFVPDLDSDTDAGYFDDFGNEYDMLKYKEVQEKQVQLQKLGDVPIQSGAFIGFTFRHKNSSKGTQPREFTLISPEFTTIL